MHGSENSDQAVSALLSGRTAREEPEKSQPLLEKFIQWQKGKSGGKTQGAAPELHSKSRDLLRLFCL